MAGTIIPWIAFFLFLVLLVGSAVVEFQWLTRKGWTTSNRAVGFIFATDILGLIVGGFVVFVAFFGVFMMVMGPAGRGSTAPDSAYLAVSAVGLVIPLIIFFLIKRIFLHIFKIKTGKQAWLYSLVSTVAMIFVIVIPPLFLYSVVTLFKL
ncbi:MAG: hypothetical protein ABL952_10950 [Pyrinomonadaceae bacterium]